MSPRNKLDPIPHPPMKPVVGNMLSLDSTAPVQNLVRLARLTSQALDALAMVYFPDYREKWAGPNPTDPS